jgi:hypothetical protein
LKKDKGYGIISVALAKDANKNKYTHMAPQRHGVVLRAIKTQGYVVEKTEGGH